MEGVEEAVTGEAAVKEAHAVGGQEREQVLRLLTLITVLEGADGAPDRQAAEDIVGRRDQALGVMAAAGIRPGHSGDRTPAAWPRSPARCIWTHRRRRPTGLATDTPREEERPHTPRRRIRRSNVSKACQGSLARALVSALRWGLCPSGHRPLRRAKVKNSPSLVATPLSRPLATREMSTTISCASGSLRRREKSWAAGLGDRLNKVEEKGEQALIKLDRSRRFFGSSSLILVSLSVYACFDVRCSHKAVP